MKPNSVEDDFSMSSHCQNIFLYMKVIKVVKSNDLPKKEEKKNKQN